MPKKASKKNGVFYFRPEGYEGLYAASYIRRAAKTYRDTYEEILCGIKQGSLVHVDEANANGRNALLLVEVAALQQAADFFD